MTEPSAPPKSLKSKLSAMLVPAIPALLVGVVLFLMLQEQNSLIRQQAGSVANTTQSHVQSAGVRITQRIAELERRVNLLPQKCISNLPVVPKFQPVVRQGKVVSASGAAKVDVGTPCTVRVFSETQARLNCRIHIRCGERDIYGPSSMAVCGIKSGLPVLAVDENPTGNPAAADRGDPMLDMNLETGVVVVSDGPPETKRFRVELQLE